MPDYVTLSELNNSLSPKERTQLSTDEDELLENEDVVTWALDSAQSLIDTFISQQVTVPMGTPTAFIKQMNLSIAKYLLFVRRGHVPDDIQLEYDRIASTNSQQPGFLFLMSRGELNIDTTATRYSAGTGSKDRAYDDAMLGVQ